jgi:hypothetical protein
MIRTALYHVGTLLFVGALVLLSCQAMLEIPVLSPQAPADAPLA